MSDPEIKATQPPEPNKISQLLDSAIEAIRSISRTQHRIQEAIELRQDYDERMDPDTIDPVPPISIYREEALTEALAACAFQASVAVTNAHRSLVALHLVYFSVRTLKRLCVQSLNPVTKSRDEEPQP